MMKQREDDEEEGLACPPMDDYALSDAFFYGDHQGASINLDLDPGVFFADSDQLYPKKPLLTTRYNGKGKEWKRVLQVLQPNFEILAKVNTRLEPMRCGLAVEGESVTKARKTVKIVVKKQVNVVMQSGSNSLTATKRPNMQIPSNDNDFELKFEATKRKLRDSYDQSNNVKKQRTTQLIDWQHLPPMPKTKPKPKVVRTKTMTRNMKFEKDHARTGC